MPTIPHQTLEPEQAQLLLATCAGGTPMDLRDRALIVVGLETGMRRMSLAAMRLEAIKPGHNGYTVCSVPIKYGGDELFNAPLSDTAIEAMAPWREWLRTQKVTKGPVFRSLRRRIATISKHRGHAVHFVGGSISTTAIYQIIKRRSVACGLSNIYPDIIRNTFITWRMQQGFQPHQVAAITGHKMSSIPGLGGLGNYIDAGRIADTARQATPPWLTEFIRKG